MNATEEQMHRIFPYISAQGGLHGLYRPQIEFRNDDEFTVGRLRFTRLEVEHGYPCCGYRVEDGERAIAYISDCHIIPEATIAKIHGVDTLVLNCLREREHPTHLKLADSLAYIKAVAPKKAYLIHMCHDFTHKEWLTKLPSGIEPAYDGEEI